MSTTTIRLTEELKHRIARAATRKGTSAHAFMLDALTDRVDEDERRQDFYDAAEQRYEAIIASGMTIPWSEMQTYLKSRAAGRMPSRPASRKLARK